MTWIFWCREKLEKRRDVCVLRFFSLCSSRFSKWCSLLVKKHLLVAACLTNHYDVWVIWCFLTICIRQHDVNILCTEKLEKRRDVCVLRFSYFSSSCSSSSQPTRWKLGHLLFFLLKNGCHHHLKFKKQS